MKKSERKKALITGGTSGIGASYSTALAGQGYDLIIVDKGLDTAKNFFIDSLEKKYNVKVRVLKADLSKDNDIKKLERYIATTKGIEYFINCAGFGLGKTFMEADSAVEEAMIYVHDIAPARLTKAVLPQMIEQKKGYIINISSLGGFIPLYGDVVYGASKSFLRMFTETLHLELVGTGVQTLLVAPGFVRTHFHDTIRPTEKEKKRFFIKWLEPEEVVFASFKALKKKEVICIPHWKYKLLYAMYKIIPRRMFYKVALKIGKKK